jgi:K+-sensing histidine kinase KdpD
MIKPISFVTVEDSKSNLKHQREVLAYIGFTIESVNSLQEAYDQPTIPDKRKVIVLSEEALDINNLNTETDTPIVLVKLQGYSLITSNQTFNAVNLADILAYLQHYDTSKNGLYLNNDNSEALLQGVSHEVRSFLNGIYGPMQLLKDKIEAKDQYDLYTMIDHSIARLIRFTFKLSLITVIQERNDTLKHEKVDITSTIQHALLELNNLKFSDTIKVEIEKQEASYNIVGDADLMVQCFQAIIERIIINYGNRTGLKISLSQQNDDTFDCNLCFPFEGILDEGKTISDQIESDFLSDIGFVIVQKILKLHRTSIHHKITNKQDVELTIHFNNYEHE